MKKFWFNNKQQNLYSEFEFTLDKRMGSFIISLVLVTSNKGFQEERKEVDYEIYYNHSLAQDRLRGLRLNKMIMQFCQDENISNNNYEDKIGNASHNDIDLSEFTRNLVELYFCKPF